MTVHRFHTMVKLKGHGIMAVGLYRDRGKMNVSEEFVIAVAQHLKDFVRDASENGIWTFLGFKMNIVDMQFEANLDNHQRRYVHAEAAKLGLQSKSYGKGEKRYITVKKRKTANGADSDVICLNRMKMEVDSTQIVYAMKMYFSQFEYTRDEKEYLDKWYMVYVWV